MPSGLRDLGPSQAPFNAWLTMLGIETLALRMERHCANAQKVAEYLDEASGRGLGELCRPAVEQVSRARQEIPAQGRGLDLHLRRQGRLRGGRQGGRQRRAVLAPRQYRRRQSLIIHPASTTHRQLSDEQRVAAGAGPDVLRLSIGIETVDDIIADLEQALGQGDFLMS